MASSTLLLLWIKLEVSWSVVQCTLANKFIRLGSDREFVASLGVVCVLG